MTDNEKWQVVKFQKSDALAQIMEDRHILDDDIKKVIQHAEETGEKLYIPDQNRFLAKLEFPNAIIYADYGIADDSYNVNTTYYHRSKFVGGS